MWEKRVGFAGILTHQNTVTKNTAADWNTARDIHPARSVHGRNLFSQSIMTSGSELYSFLSSLPTRHMAKGDSRVKARL